MTSPPPSSSLTPPASPPREEDEAEAPPPMDSPAPEAEPPKPFDPLKDILGLDAGSAGAAHGMPTAHPNMAMQVYNANGGMMPGAYQPASVDQSVAERVANVKGMMANGGQQQRGGFGVDGTNMHVAMHGGPQNIQAQQRAQQQAQQHAQQQMYNSVAMQQYQQQQQQLAAYQTMAYQTMAYQSMAAGQQLQVYQPQQAYAMQGMYGMQNANGMQNMNGMQRMGMMNAVGLYVPTPQGSGAVPVMQAEKTVAQPQAFRVQRGTKPTRVSDSDKAFGPILDRLKKDVVAKK